MVAVVGAFALLLVPVAANGANGHANYHAVCPGPPAGFAHCHALVVTDSNGNPLSSSSPTGLSPTTIRNVYGFPTSTTAGSSKTIGIVDAYDDPTAESDLGTFSSQLGLPACTTANGCFKKVNQTGGTRYPSSNQGWGLEISLDIQWAHAIAPGAKILLVEASSNSFANLMAAESYAAGHAQYVSNSWGGGEFSGETSYDSYFSGTGVSFFVSSGDSGLPAEWPSASPNVISVGGTTLSFNADGSLKSETGWADGGGGCSSMESATAAQSGFAQYGQAGCNGKRATPDVSLDADPASGVSVYDSSYGTSSGWLTVGGTSASSPMWAAASADNGAVVDSAYVYGSSITYRDITAGGNSGGCKVGYDLCSGRGSWLFGSGGTQQPVLTISGGGQTITSGQQSRPMTVSISTPPTNDLVVSLLTTGGGTFSPTSVTIPGGSTTSGPFTYTDSTTGTFTLTASAGGATSGTTTITVNSATQSPLDVAVSAGSVSGKGPNYHVPLTVSTTSGTSLVSGASVSLAVHSGTCLGTVVATGTGTTGSGGTAAFTFTTRVSGSWCATATATAPGYSAGTNQPASFTTP